MENILELQNVRKTYKKFSLKDISFTLPGGYIMGLIGPNGAGKTTIIKLIMNLIRRDGGSISVFGKDIIKHEREIKANIGFVYDEPRFFLDVTLKNIKSAYAPFYEKWNDERFNSLVAEFQLPLKKKYKKLSRGQKTKFALALALSHDADLIIMDEPTAGLDTVFRRELLHKLSSLLQDERKSILFSTHITSDLEKIADYITFIDNGRIVFSLPREDVLDNWGIAKGGEELLNKDLEHLFYRFHKTEFGVEALTPNIHKVHQHFNSHLVLEKANLEDIMYFFSKGEDYVF